MSLLYITINNVSIPIKPVSPQDRFLPSPETMYAWYLAHYGTSNLFDLEPEMAIASIEKLAKWWADNLWDSNAIAQKRVRVGLYLYPTLPTFSIPLFLDNSPKEFS